MFFALNWTSWKKWMLAVILILLTITSVHFSTTYVLNVGSPDATPSGAITKSLKGEPEIALTFNVKWGDDVIIDILDVLQQQDVQATFFINGEWALRNEDLAELIIEENHEVGLLGFYDDPYKEKSATYIEEDIENGTTVLTNLGYEPLTYVRPPENEYDQFVIDTIQQLGYESVFWSIYANVKHNSEAEEVSQHLSDQVDEGDIMLFFAQDNLTVTPDVIENLIENKKEEGYQFLTVTELLSPANVDITPLD
ncbi:polysaccharide deacetylase family protein [Alkalibacillus haloalkaliphilus]|uniref:polysaccharide deacetylase family protein n=1 Tax=Alkalibacillus haloalkaliphilus TaxID=94136 RepID=UPI002935F8B4|nr:polysaccharide deacetylase family protein [Alkalibacillus haloalkaliphilus]MDV2582604.1 polysaccharide deacetylase family protein [Alkalibacillus haloalkaliphilus]